MGIPTLISFLKKIRDSIQDGGKGVKKQVPAQNSFLAPALLPTPCHKLARPASDVVYYQVDEIFVFKMYFLQPFTISVSCCGTSSITSRPFPPSPRYTANIFQPHAKNLRSRETAFLPIVSAVERHLHTHPLPQQDHLAPSSFPSRTSLGLVRGQTTHWKLHQHTGSL